MFWRMTQAGMAREDLGYSASYKELAVLFIAGGIFKRTFVLSYCFSLHYVVFSYYSFRTPHGKCLWTWSRYQL